VGLRQKLLMGVAGVILVFISVLIVFGDKGLSDLRILKQAQLRQTQDNEALGRRNLSRYREIDRLASDLVYIESVARKELGVIRPNEVILKFANKEK
jgi:cell division protein FtsB